MSNNKSDRAERVEKIILEKYKAGFFSPREETPPDIESARIELLKAWNYIHVECNGDALKKIRLALSYLGVEV
jgi:hypothetical protein